MVLANLNLFVVVVLLTFLFKLLIILFGDKSVLKFRFLQELLSKNGGWNSTSLENLVISLQIVE